MLERLFKDLGPPHQLRRHQYLACAGEVQDSIYAIQEGWAGRFTVLDSRQRQFTALYLPGDLCEPQWLIRPRSNESIIALSPMRVVRVPIVELTGSGQHHIEPYAMLSSVLQLIDRQASWIVSLGRKAAVERICTVLIELFDRTRNSDRAGDNSFAMPLTQSELADMVGLTPIHVNRVLKELRDRGVLDVHRRTATIHDPETLREIASARMTA